MDSSIPSSSPPPPKKPKMSTTTTSDDEENPNFSEESSKKPQRFKRRKIAIFLAYCGVGYQGMQKNPGAKTIEADLEEALFHSGAVPTPDRGNPKRFDWARSARTDKGVSAVGQVVSGRFYVDPPGLVARLNSHLPPQIRIFGYKRVTASFNAKKFCDRRRYVYLLPVFALDPNCHRDRESVIASAGSGNELVKCLECSERGRKVAGIMGRRRADGESSDSSVLESMVFPEVETCSKNEGLIEIKGGGHAPETRIGCEQGKIEVNVGAMENNDGSVIELKNSSEEEKNEETDASLNEGLNGKDGGPALETRVNFEVGKSEVTVETVENNDRSALELKNSSEEEKIEEIEASSGRKGGPPVVSMFSCEEGKGEKNGEIEGNVRDAVFDDGVSSKDEKTGKTGPFCSESGELTGAIKGGEFCYGEKERERFNGILKRYVGTHNFHNFTTRTKAEDPSARRYIVSFNADDVVSIDGMEFVRCEVVGQSFMLHQIRKLIGLAVAAMRNCAPEALIETALKKDINVNVPTAPEVGLYLDECLFTSYNQKWKDSHEEVSMEVYKEEAEDFKMNYIYSHIASMEQKEGVVALWLHSLNHRNYPDFRLVEANGTCADMNRTQEAKMEE
eukprot:TRINITY_DN4215_c0_g1_i2.p1 TRINITY_DN4215_c0_g1~~TRINITY_DN4215_c0_g1_i2.p1  ORF type:complete len:620 (+),score=134.83 TRINITY_DN4215_c0_g1_i2:87-1946(+)